MKRFNHMAGQFRTAFLSLVIICLILLCAIMVVGCSGDDDSGPMPSYTAIFAEALTDHNGHIRSLRDDSGHLWTVTNVDTTAATANTPDSLYRVKAWVLPDNASQRLKVLSLEWLYSYKPQRAVNMVVKHDPVEAVSATITPRYLNMRLAIRCSKIEDHRFGFIEESIIRNTDGTKTLTISLYHDKRNDPSSYVLDELFCCPIYQYAGTLTPNSDKVKLVVHTKDAPFVQEWTFPQANGQQ